MPLSTIDINGYAADRTSALITLAGSPLFSDQITKIKYGFEITRSDLYGGSSQPIGRTRGKAKFTCEVSMYKDAFDDFIDFLSIQSPLIGFAEFPFTTQVQYRNILGRIKTDLITGCKMAKGDDDTGEGEDAMIHEMPLSCMMILYNGRSPISLDKFRR